MNYIEDCKKDCMKENIRISGIVNDSIVDGIGMRMTVFTQGCPHACVGCHNPQTHDFLGGYDEKIQLIFDKFASNPLLKGITLSGGEPFMQAKKLIPLCEAVKAKGGDIWIYSGFLYEEIMADIVPFASNLLSICDVLVDGKFEIDKIDLTLWYRGSKNQRVIDVNKTMRNHDKNAIVLMEFDE